MAKKPERHGAALTKIDANGDMFAYARVSCVIKIHLGNAEELKVKRGRDWFHATEIDEAIGQMCSSEVGEAVLEHIDVESVIRHEEPITKKEIDLG